MSSLLAVHLHLLIVVQEGGELTMNQHRQPCSCNSCHQTQWHQPAAQPVVCPPQYRVRDSFSPRMQPVIHPIVNVNREHIVNVPQHFYTVTNQNVMAPGSQQAFPMQGQFPQQSFGQPFGQQFGQQQFGQQQFFPGQNR